MDKKFYQHYWDNDLKKLVSEHTNIQSFDSHCQQVADQLGIHKSVVKTVLKDYAFYVLKTLQDKTVKRLTIKINIYGYFSFRSLKNIKFNFIRL